MLSPKSDMIRLNKIGYGEDVLMEPRQVQRMRAQVSARDIEDGMIAVGVDEESRIKKPVAHIVIGFIGSGKTTFAREREKETGAVRFTKDEWMVRLFGNTPPKDTFEEYDHKMALLATETALKCLRAGIDVIIDEGFWVKEQRDEIREKVKNVGAAPEMYYLSVPFEVMKERTLRRTANPPGDSFTIDEESFNHYWTFFQPPDKDEECRLIGETFESVEEGHPMDKLQ